MSQGVELLQSTLVTWKRDTPLANSIASPTDQTQQTTSDLPLVADNIASQISSDGIGNDGLLILHNITVDPMDLILTMPRFLYFLHEANTFQREGATVMEVSGSRFKIFDTEDSLKAEGHLCLACSPIHQSLDWVQSNFPPRFSERQ